MAGFLWASAADTAFETQLEKTTSELLPSSSPPDLLASLQLADSIRSSAITPVFATRSLLARLTHANPNVQILAVAVIDICIKNGGMKFLVQVGGKEFADAVEGLARGKVGGNRDVKELVLRRLQDWATAFQQMDQLKHCELVKSYERLKSEGSPFPPRDPTATAAMVDSLSAPEWTDATYCTRCRTDFSTFNRKHHCRSCGQIFDQQCSSHSLPLPHYGITSPVRVCDGCFKKLQEGVTPKPPIGRASSYSTTPAVKPGAPERSKSTRAPSSKQSKEDADLEAAIAASLADVGQNNASSTAGPAFQLRDPAPASSKGYNPSYGSSAKASVAPAVEEEEDADLAAAIAASLRDVAPAPSAPGEYDAPAATYSQLYPSANAQPQYSNPYPSLAPPHNSYTPAPAAAATPNPYDLSQNDTLTLTEFVNTLERPPPMLGTRERDLYDAASAAGNRVARGIEDAQRRREILMEMEGKLGEATRLYEGLLDSRVNRSYSAPVNYAPPQHAQYSTAAPPQPPTAYYAPPQQYALQPHHEPQPLPALVTQSYHHHPQYAPPAQQHPTSPESYAAAPYPASSQHQQPSSPQQAHQEPQQQHVSPQQHQQHQQPAGYYKPSQFPSVPQGPQAMLFPSVPAENPWEEQERARKEEEAKVGELIEL